MKLREIVLQIREHRQLVAVWDEVLEHLGTFRDGEKTIPYEDGDVDEAYVEMVFETFRSQREAAFAMIKKLEELEVSDGSNGDPDGGGEDPPAPRAPEKVRRGAPKLRILAREEGPEGGT